jgi:hypothetical protein
MTAPHSPPSPDDTTRKTNLNLTHVAAASLAAVTAAVLGSELGATGTLIGAAGASVITTVGTAVYQASLERSRERVRFLAQRAQRAQPSPTCLTGSRTERFHPTAANAPLGDKRLTNSTDRRPQPWDRSRRFTTLRWGSVAMGTLGGFVLAMIVITGFEWASGETIGGNGKGTTIGRVVNDQPGPQKPAIPPPPHSSTGPTSETPTETPDTPTPTTTPDGSAGVEHSPPKTSDRPAPSEVTPTPPLIQLPGVGG